MAYRRGFSSQADYFEEENKRRGVEHENDYWHSESGQYHLRYNASRNDEIRKRNAEIVRHMKSFYFSNKVVIILIGSAVLSLLTIPKDFVLGVISWNFLIFIALLFFCFVTVKTQIRPEIRNRHQAIISSAREKAFGHRRRY